MEQKQITEELAKAFVNAVDDAVAAVANLAREIVKALKRITKLFLEYIDKTVYRNYRTYRNYVVMLNLKPSLINYIRIKISIYRLIRLCST